MVTSWIDGSFIYSTSETWVNTMRSFKNGTFKTDQSLSQVDPERGFPPRNKERAPLINAPPAHHLKMITPERMFCEFNEPFFISLFQTVQSKPLSPKSPTANT